MKTWKKIALITLGVFAIGAIRVYFIWRERNAPVAETKPKYVERRLTSDDVVTVRHLYIDDLKSAKALEGKTVWMQAGYQIPYYGVAGKHVEVTKRLGLLPNAEKIEIKEFVEQAVPESVDDRVPHGTKQYFAVYTKADDPKHYAMAVGVLKGTDQTFYCDQIFYYDDPHVMYKHWPADVWAAIDKHEPIVGMSELQAMMALGQVVEWSSDSVGNRTIHYTAGDHHWTVVFEKDKATSVKQDS